ncbi:MAG TPA: ATP-binding protein [Gemmataceae bacterium]|jgi:two-component system phosphate regulon sensor histidine kinase PhoR|nr:ATP-binding protein [Gemmataceae bacterium]
MFVRLLVVFVAFGVLSAALAVALRELGAVPVFALVILLAVGPAVYFAKVAVRSFRAMTAAVDRVAEGDFTHRFDGGPWREGHELALHFSAMSAAVTNRIDRLEAEQNQLRAVLGGMAEGVVAVGAGQRVLFANAAAASILEFDPGPAIGRPLWEIARHGAVQDLLERARKAGEPQREEIEIKTPPARHLTVYVAPLNEADGPGAVLVFEDTSELRRLESVRQEFVANVSHELKTPLAVIQATAEALQDGAVEDIEVRGPFLQQIADQSARLHALILDLLSLAKVESGDAEFELEPLPIGEMVAACIDRHRPRAEAKGMTLEMMPLAEDLHVWADGESLAQILDNLVDNAVKYTQAGGHVGVSWAAESANVCIAVEDNGPGIPEVDLPRVFARFYRVDRARSRELGGTGLGLAIVKRLAQAMDGSVKVESTMGKGTRFTVHLPRQKAR